MRRIVTAGLLIASLASCDPTGNIPPGANTADVRVANLVVDVPSIDVVTSGGTSVNGTPFGVVADAEAINTLTTSLETRDHGDGTVLGTESVDLIPGRTYTFYALGKLGGFEAVLAADDTGPLSGSTYRLRFVHGLGQHLGQGLDVYLTAPGTSLTGLAPSISNTAFGAASAYVSADTAFRRVRVALTGLPTIVFDTTFATPLADSGSFSFVVTDAAGGGLPATLHLVTDRTP